MHPNPVFHGTDRARDIAFVRARGFGTLVVNANPAPHMSFVPLLLSEDGGEALLHLVRSNPIARALAEPQPARIGVGGPDGYISPDWYGTQDQVPTWNYVAVELTGTLERLPQDRLRALLDLQSGFYEDRLHPKTPWTMEKMSADARDRLMRMIVPCRMRVDEIASTWKLGQNKPDSVRNAAADRCASGLGQELAQLAALMRHPPSPT